MATITAAPPAVPSPSQAATAGWLAPWARDSNMSSIKTYDRTIRKPVRYIRTERAPAPAPATAAPLYPGQARQASGRIFGRTARDADAARGGANATAVRDRVRDQPRRTVDWGDLAGGAGYFDQA